MALSQVSTGDIILAAHHNSIVQLLTGVAGSGESVTFVYNAAPALAFKPSSNPVALTEAIQIQNAAGTVLGSITFDGYVHAASGAVGNPGFSFKGDTNTGVYRSAADTVDIAAGGVRAAQFSTVASAVNYLDIAPSATGNAVTATAEGTDTNVSINLIPKGSGTVQAAGSQVVAHSIVDAKGDILAASAADTIVRVAVGANDTVLTADSTQAAGVKWAAVTTAAHGASSHTDRTRDIYVPAAAWGTTGPATLAYTTVNTTFWLSWEMDAAAAERVATTFLIPADWASGTITYKVYFAMASATSGNVVLNTVVRAVADGEVTDSTADFDQSDTVAVPGTAEMLKVHTVGATHTIAAGDLVGISFARLGDNVNDTATGDLYFLGMEIEYTADM